MLHRIAIAIAVCACGAEAAADTVVLANGDTLTGEVVEWDFHGLVIDHPQLGRLRLALGQLDLDAGTPPPAGLLGTDFLRGWSRRLDVGLVGEDGNSNSLDLTAGLELSYEDDFKRWAFTGRYFFGSEDDETTDNNGRFELRRDFLRPGSRWFARAVGVYQFDDFEAWRQRLTTTAGPGYRLVETERHALDAVVGPAYTREFGQGGDDKLEAAFGLDYAWQISSLFSLELRNQLFSEIGPDTGDLRNLTLGSGRWTLSEDPELSLVVGFQNEWESAPDANDEPNDLDYFLSLGIGF